MVMDFKVGQTIDWLHNDNFVCVEVLIVEDDKVYLEGVTSNYWMSKKTLINKINRSSQGVVSIVKESDKEWWEL